MWLLLSAKLNTILRTDFLIMFMHSYSVRQVSTAFYLGDVPEFLITLKYMCSINPSEKTFDKINFGLRGHKDAA